MDFSHQYQIVGDAWDVRWEVYLEQKHIKYIGKR